MRRRTRFTTLLTTLALAATLTACGSGSTDAAQEATASAPTSATAAPATTASGVALASLSGTCQGASDAAGPITFTEAEIHTEGELLVVTAELADGASEPTYPSAVFSATLVGSSGGIVVAGLKPANAAGQAVYTFDMSTSQNTYQNGTFTFTEGQVSYRVPLSAFEGLGAVTGWSFTIENDGSQTDACGSAYDPEPVS